MFKSLTSSRYVMMTILLVGILITSLGAGYQNLQQQQQQQLESLSQDYLTLKERPNLLASWQRHHQLQIATAPFSNQTQFSRLAAQVYGTHRLTHQNPNGQLTFKNSRYQGYLVLDSQQRVVALIAQPRVKWYQLFTTYLTLSVILGLFFIGVVLIILWRSWYQQRHVFAAIDTNLQKLQRHEPPQPILLNPEDTTYSMTYHLNNLAENVEHEWHRHQLYKQSMSVLIDHLPVGIIVLNHQGRVKNANQALHHILGLEEQSVLGSFYLDTIKNYRLAHMVEHALAHPQKYRHQQEMIELLGHDERFVSASVVTLTSDTTQSPLRVVVMLYDLTDLHRAEVAQLDFVSNASHELRTPITSIKGFAETLLAGAAEDPKTRRDFMTIIYQQAERLEALVQDILALSKLGQKPSSEISVVDLPEQAQKVIQALQPEIQQRHLQVELEDMQLARPVYTDRNKMEHIFKNLITNAVRYNKDNGDLKVSLQSNSNYFTIQVKDTGVGLIHADQERIFERFYRVDRSRSQDTGGTGLGLAIVMDTVKSLNGAVSVKSQLGVGSTFKVQIPQSKFG